MASSIIGTAVDLGRKVANRYRTVVGDDWREAESRANAAGRMERDFYRYNTGRDGSSQKSRKPDPRKRARTSSSGR